jgi:hypothetical protein
MWQRAQADVTIASWRRFSRTERQAVEAEAATLPLSGIRQPVRILQDSWRPPGHIKTRARVNDMTGPTVGM